MARLLAPQLLDPISEEQPCGTDLQLLPEWDRIREARRSDDGLPTGKWGKKDQKEANWRQAYELAQSALSSLSKHLQVALWMTEADTKLRGFPGLADGLSLVNQLTETYWDKGLYPSITVGPEDRSGPFDWLNQKLSDTLLEIPITARSDAGADFNMLALREARRVGRESDCTDQNGDSDPQKKRSYQAALAEGRSSLEMFDAAVLATDRETFEKLYRDFAAAQSEFKELRKTVQSKFGEFAPALSDCKAVLEDIDLEMSKVLAKKQEQEPAKIPKEIAFEPNGSANVKLAASVRNLPSLSSHIGNGSGSWEQAEELIRSGEIDKGLAEMTRLAASETTGRNRFQHKLLLAEASLASNRRRLARTILEELAAQIDKFQLETWESSELIAAVWTRLYELYKRDDSSDGERAQTLYERLCHLDPWQALACGE